jgi:Tol biopolymer transport system component
MVRRTFRLLAVAMLISLLWLLAGCASDYTQQQGSVGEQPNHPQQGGVREEKLRGQEQQVVFEETTHVQSQEGESEETPRSEQGGVGEVPEHKLTACGSGDSQQQVAPSRELDGKIAFASQIYASTSTSPNVSASVSAGENASVHSSARAEDVVRGPLDLCVINADGTGLTRITNTPEDESSPLWSPDGDKIAFLGPPDGINVANADGSAQTPLPWSGSTIPSTSYTGNRAWAWSPDGRTFAYTSGCEMYIAPAEGSGTLRKFTIGRPVRALDPTPTYKCLQSPTWSPNGKQIAFTNVTQEGNDGLYVMNVSREDDKHQSRKLTNDPAAGLSWSPDGSEIAFVRAGSYSTQIYKINVNNLKATRLAGGIWPTWSPDGEKIAFVGTDGINVMDADGSNVTPVFDAAGVTVSEPVWQTLP